MPEATLRFIDPADDPWQAVTADDAEVATPSARPFALLTLAQWQAVGPSWPAGVPVGLALGNDSDIEGIADALPRLALVALQFPSWTDGRAYSQARLLRTRFAYAGEVRATGVVLADMAPLLWRSGFDAAVLRADQSLAVARRALSFFPEGHYQGDVHEALPRFRRGEAATS